MIARLYHKYKDFILYLFFGVCTTLVNIVTYFISTRAFHLHVLGSTVLAWCFAVLFAYFTNKEYVFKSQNHTLKAILFELISFISCRLFTGGIDFGIMFVFVEKLQFNDMIIKIISNLIVIIGNYAASKLFIFKQHNY